MNKHTPGPWKAYYVGCSDWDLNGPVTQEDWVLAAAAPELLEALLEYKRLYEEVQPSGGWQGVYEIGNAAIAKATGVV
jgi:hypothetical protein